VLTSPERWLDVATMPSLCVIQSPLRTCACHISVTTHTHTTHTHTHTHTHTTTHSHCRRHDTPEGQYPCANTHTHTHTRRANTRARARARARPVITLCTLSHYRHDASRFRFSICSTRSRDGARALWGHGGRCVVCWQGEESMGAGTT